MAEKVFLNDKLVDIGRADVSVADSGFLYGAGLFETMRANNGVVFALKDHLDRLFFSAGKLAINNTYSKEQITDAIYNVLDANKLKDARLRLTLTSGSVSMAKQEPKSTLVITATKLEPYPAEFYKNGVMVILCPYRQNPDDPTCGYKTTNYFARLKALDFARAHRATEAIWFTTDNRLAEGCISNVFLVKDSVLYTPALNTPVLAGVARKTVCQLVVKNSIGFVEKNLDIDDLLGADEVFLTNVIMKILPVSRIEKHIIGEGKTGAMTEKVQKLFDEFVKENCRQRK